MVKGMVLKNRRFCLNKPKLPKSPSFKVENWELMLLGLPSSFRFYHFVDPQTTGGRFYFGTMLVPD